MTHNCVQADETVKEENMHLAYGDHVQADGSLIYMRLYLSPGEAGDQLEKGVKSYAG